YHIRRGTVDFTDAARTEPNIDLALETRVQRYDITLTVTGTPATIEASLSSPGLSREDVVSVLLTGQPADRSSIAYTEVARGQLLMLLSGELLGFAGRAVGHDTVRVGRGLGGAASDFDLMAVDTNPDSRLTLSKHLRRDVEIVFSQSLRDNGDITWIATYLPLRATEIRATTKDDGSRAYEFRHELQFGGVASRRRLTGTRPAPSRITAIRITGSPGFGESVLRKRLRLNVGDQLDFARLQEDRDRLAAFYHQHDFLEARIVARRRTDPRESGASDMTLEYAIDRGPRTVLAVDGASLPGRLVDDIRTAWSRSVFDAFLLEDLARLVRRHLVEDGYLQSTVTPTVASFPESDTKEIAVHVSAGPRFSDRRIALVGAEAESAALQTFVRTQRLDVTGWLDPRALEDALTRHYHSLGHLAAHIRVDPPVFAPPSATLPVQVRAGPLFRIARVTVHGAKAKSEADVRDVFGLAAEATYRLPVLEPARQAVELAYLRDGYNDVRVEATTHVDRQSALVDISLNVDEGRQQIISRIDLTGTASTARSTIDRAVKLEVGQPATLTESYRSQKRLYDTGVFQSVNVAIEPIEGPAVPGGQTQPVRVTVALQELPRYRFRYGFRMNDDVGQAEAGRDLQPAFVVDLLRRNLFGRAISTGIAGQVEHRRRLARGVVSLPQLFGLPAATNLFLTAAREEFTPEGAAFIEDRSEITAEQRLRVGSRSTLSYGYSFGRAHVFDRDPIPGLPPFDVVVKTARLTGTLAWDSRDDPADARSGWFHSSGLEYGPGRLGSDVRYIRYLAQQSSFKVLGRVVLASGLRLGAGRGFGQDLLFTQKFFAGGGNSVRGFAEDGLGAKDFLGQPSGGNALLIVNQEVRVPLYRWLRGVGFVDAGNVFARARDFSFTNLEAGAGFGLRIASPFALVRIDFGMPLTRRQREPLGRWYFAIGHTF
ncbi:MAG: translocation/assembly module TamB domain-containing protein, partial [Vicinamibacterales bacterium]